MWDLPWPEIEPMSPALTDGLLITRPGKSKSGKPSGSLVMVVLMKILFQISTLPLTGYVITGNLITALCEIRRSLFQSVNIRIIVIHIFWEYLFRGLPWWLRGWSFYPQCGRPGNHHVPNTVSVNQTQLWIRHRTLDLSTNEWLTRVFQVVRR